MYLHALLCTYGTVVGLAIIDDYVDEHKLWDQTFVNTITNEHFKADFWIVLNYLTQTQSLFMGVVMLCAVVSVMLYLFFGYHVYLIYYGYSTNEMAKHQQLKYYLGKAVSFLTKWEKIKKDDKEFSPSESSILYYDVKADWTLKQI